MYEQRIAKCKQELVALHIEIDELEAAQKRGNETFVLAGINVSEYCGRRVVIRNTKELRDVVNRFCTEDKYLFINVDGYMTWASNPESEGGSELVEEIRARKSDWNIY